jgi:hypothetical protein
MKKTLRLVPAAILVVVLVGWLLYKPAAKRPRAPMNKAEVLAAWGEPKSGWRPIKRGSAVAEEGVRYGIWPNGNPSGETRIVWLDADDQVAGTLYARSTALYQKWLGQSPEE